MVRQSLMVLCLMVVIKGAAWGCDTDLVALFTGENRQDVFSQAIFQLASEARQFGTRISSASPDNAGALLARLKKTWLTFDNRFSQSPPYWAKDDKRWTDKFKELATLIGKIDREFQAGRLTPAHDKTWAFSRQLMTLFEGMPVPPERAALISVTRGFQTTWEAIHQGAANQFEDGLRELLEGASALKSHLATSTLLVAHEFIAKVEQLQRLYQAQPGSITPDLCVHVHNTETAFRELTVRLRRQSN